MRLLLKPRIHRWCNKRIDPRVQRDYTLHDGLLFYTAGGRQRRLCVPDLPRLRLQLLQWHHDGRISGHLGFDKTYAQLVCYYSIGVASPLTPVTLWPTVTTANVPSLHPKQPQLRYFLCESL